MFPRILIPFERFLLIYGLGRLRAGEVLFVFELYRFADRRLDPRGRLIKLLGLGFWIPCLAFGELGRLL